MALVHDFMLIGKDVDIMDIKVADRIHLHDGLIQYISDSMLWVETYWNKDIDMKQGLNYYGYTIFKKESIANLKNIILAWKDLFNNATETFELTGNFLSDQDDYERHIFLKKEVIDSLDKINDLCDMAITMDKYILHMGI